MMKALIASLVVLGSLPVLAEEAPNLLKKNVSFDGVDIEISELFEIVGMNLNPSPNVVFKGAAGEQRVPRLRVKDVSLGSLFKVIESVADVEIELIDESVTDGSNSDDPFGGGVSTKRLTSSGIIVVSSNAPPKRNPPSGLVIPVSKAKPAHVKSVKVETEVISLVDLKIPEESLIDAIKMTWDAVDQNLKNRASIAFHEPSKLLIVSGPAEAIEAAQKTVSALLPSYRELIQTKTQSQVLQFSTTRQAKVAEPHLDASSYRRNSYGVPKVKAVPKVDLPSLPERAQPAAKRGASYLEARPEIDIIEVPQNARPLPGVEALPKPIPLPGR